MSSDGGRPEETRPTETRVVAVLCAVLMTLSIGRGAPPGGHAAAILAGMPAVFFARDLSDDESPVFLPLWHLTVTNVTNVTNVTQRH